MKVIKDSMNFTNILTKDLNFLGFLSSEAIDEFK